MLLVFLCLLISALLYVRTRIVDRLRRVGERDPQQENQEQRRQENLGVFPAPGDPAVDDWAILR